MTTASRPGYRMIHVRLADDVADWTKARASELGLSITAYVELVIRLERGAAPIVAPVITEPLN